MPYTLSIYVLYPGSETLRKKCPYSELFQSAFSRIRIEYGEILRILRISPYSVRMWENADQNKSEYGYFLRSYTNMNTPEMYLGPCQKTIMNKTIFARRLHASQMFDRVLNTSLVPFNQLSRYVLNNRTFSITSIASPSSKSSYNDDYFIFIKILTA